MKLSWITLMLGFGILCGCQKPPVPKPSANETLIYRHLATTEQKPINIVDVYYQDNSDGTTTMTREWWQEYAKNDHFVECPHDEQCLITGETVFILKGAESQRVRKIRKIP